jgi:hypothetical protein
MGEYLILNVIVIASILLSSSFADSIDAYGRKENKLSKYQLNTQFILPADGGQ